ncbi:MAG TPA: hypothetical protein PKD53_01630 [Chloroflexaceae bacterium]|nr:hypothetical protein [Chloroflexaceae bacterium]
MNQETTTTHRHAGEREAAAPRGQARELSDAAAMVLSLIITAVVAGLVSLVIDLVIRSMG